MALHSDRAWTCLINKWIFPGVRQSVKSSVEVVEEVDNLHGPFPRRVLAAEGIEAHNAAEEDSHVVISLCGHRTLVPQLVGHRWREHGIQQPVQREQDRATMRAAESCFSASTAHFSASGAVCTVKALLGAIISHIHKSRLENINNWFVLNQSKPLPIQTNSKYIKISHTKQTDKTKDRHQEAEVVLCALFPLPNCDIHGMKEVIPALSSVVWWWWCSC